MSTITKEKYTTRTQVERILNGPGMYVGSVTFEEKKDRIIIDPLFFEDKAQEDFLIIENVISSDALEKIFNEVLTNATDNIIRTRAEKTTDKFRKKMFSSTEPPIKVTVNESSIKVWNTGLPLEVRESATYTQELNENDPLFEDKKKLFKKGEKPIEKVLIPELVFGRLGTSENYTGTRSGAGVNGLGVKLTNIFSSSFRVTVGDPKNKKHYTGLWEGYTHYDGNDRLFPTKREITSYPADGLPFVEVEFTPNFSLFKTAPKKLNDKLILLFAKIVYDASYAIKVPISFNDQIFDYTSPIDYSLQYFPKQIVDTQVTFYQWRENDEPHLKKDISEKIEKGKIDHLPIIEAVILDTPPDDHRVIGFVNGIEVNQGKHVELINSAVASIIKNIILNSKHKKIEITEAQIKKHFSIIVNVNNIADPEFKGQTKNVLDSYSGVVLKDGTIDGKKQKDGSMRGDIKVDLSVLTPLIEKSIKSKKWGTLDRILKLSETRVVKEAKQTDGVKTKYVKEDVNGASKAGTSESEKCTLYLGEGQTAIKYGISRIDKLPGKRTYNGYYALRGKVPNPYKDKKSVKGQVYSDIKKILGLKEGHKYTNLNELRYGRVVIATDADDDGIDILGTLIAFFSKWPELIELNFVCYLATPIIRVTDKKTNKLLYRFYNDFEYETWFKTCENKCKTECDHTRDTSKFEIKYYKGLGTSENSDIKDDMITAPIVIMTTDVANMWKHALEREFCVQYADERKKAMIEMQKMLDEDKFIPLIDFQEVTENALETQTPQIIKREIMDLMKTDTVFYGMATVARSTAALDGLKEVQRLITYYTLNEWNYGNTQKKGKKVIEMAGRIMGDYKYAHGDASLNQAIIRMSQSFPGSNNLPILKGIGQYGSRSEGTSTKVQPSARYVFSMLGPWMKHLCSREMIDVTIENIVEGVNVGPKYFLPIALPILLLNGCIGLGKGWNNDIPPHKIDDVVNALYHRFDKGVFPELRPGVEGFKGDMVRVTNFGEGSNKKVFYEDEEETKEYKDLIKSGTNRKLKWACRGKMQVTETKKKGVFDIEITEIPILGGKEGIGEKSGGYTLNEYERFLHHLRELKMIDHFDLGPNATSNTPHYLIKNYRHQTLVDNFPIEKTKSKPKGKKEAKGKKEPKAEKDEKKETFIKDIKPPSKDDKKVYTPPTLDDLALITKFNTFGMNVYTPHQGFVTHYTKTSEIFESYYEEMKDVFTQVRTVRINKAETSLNDSKKDKMIFDAVFDNKLILFEVKEKRLLPRPEKDILDDLKTLKLSEDRFSKFSIRDFNKDFYERLIALIKRKEEDLKKAKSTTSIDIWRGMIDEFVKTGRKELIQEEEESDKEKKITKKPTGKKKFFKKD